MPKRLRPLAPLLLAFSALGAGPCATERILVGLPSLAGQLPVEIVLTAGTDPGAAIVTLDGADVTGLFSPGGPGLVGTIPVPAPGSHLIQVTAPIVPIVPVPLTAGKRFQSPGPAPAIVGASPVAGASIPRTRWLRFDLASAPSASALLGFGFALECNGERRARSAHLLDGGTLVLNPTPELPPGASCRVVWRDEGGNVAEHAFSVPANAAGGDARVHHDRRNPVLLTPFPDDYYTEDDASQPTGVAVDIPVPPFDDPFQQEVFTALKSAVGPVDGWSRQSPIVLAFSHPLDASAVPADGLAAQDPLAPIALIDVDPSSPDYGKRIAYRLVLRTDVVFDGSLDHAAILFPGIDLREGGRYAVVVTRQAFASGTPGRPLAPSVFFSELLAVPSGPEDPEIERARRSIDPTLAALAALPDLPIPPEDIAVVARVSIRTHPGVEDLVAVKELALASPPPALVLPNLAVNPCPTPASFCIRLIANRPRVLEVRGRVRLPSFLDVSRQIVRDPVTGDPVSTGITEVPFVLTLPSEAMDGPVIPVIYQHGNPGSSNEVTGTSQEVLNDAGFAVMGFTDTLNREFGQDIALQVQAIFFLLLQAQSMPYNWFQTTADQIHFLRAVQAMGSLDLLSKDAGGNPAIGPDGIPDIDPSVILYKGISEGANNAQRFLPFAPEILAAEATVGGARLGETLIHQAAGEILAQLDQFLPQIRPVELWSGLSLFQGAFDPQDGHTALRHLYREPLLPFAGSSDVTPPSTIWTEGVGDSLVPNNASRAMAAELGIPHVRPVRVPVPDIPEVDAPLAENIAPGITSGYFQYLPSATPYCIAVGELEGHYCPQRAPEARAQRLHFLQTAIEGSPEIIEPF